MRRLENLRIRSQPTDFTCGPTCLHAVYSYYGDHVDLQRVINEIPTLPEGGTLAVRLANHALARGYHCTLCTYNLQIFDPTWFKKPSIDIIECLKLQQKAKSDAKLRLATPSYLEFLERGGQLKYHELNRQLIHNYLKQEIPVLTGLSATYLYGCARETNDYDDISGEPTGHFVILSGYDSKARKIFITDPQKDNPRFGETEYAVSFERLIGAILLGIITYDANLLIIEPR
ncbi:MAG: hypothetical protein JW841_05305 [Deltaproteobacteria bacterium]|nr:hypothetical protein [Deltaproteobacteria bacterium]